MYITVAYNMVVYKKQLEC